MLLSGRVLALYTIRGSGLLCLKSKTEWKPQGPGGQKRGSLHGQRAIPPLGNSVCHEQRLTPALTFSGVFSWESRSVNEG